VKVLDKVAGDLVEMSNLGLVRQREAARRFFVKVSVTRPYVLTDGERKKRIPPKQAAALFALMCKPLVSVADLSEIFWPNPDAMPDTWVSAAKQHIHHLRRALLEFGVDVENVYGRGWRLPTLPNR